MEGPDIRLFKGNQFFKIQISVRHARTHIDDGKAQFTDYEIELKTNHIAFTLKNSKVRKRYSDFVWLRNRLLTDTATDPPSLPARRWFGRFNKDFIKQRQNKLQDFLFGLVQNNVFLSHAALHLFLQSKLNAEEIDNFLKSNIEEDASETILAESEGRVRLDEIITRDRTGSKHDSGFSGDYDEPDWLLQSEAGEEWMKDNKRNSENLDVMNNNDNISDHNVNKDDEIFSDGHAGDVESEDEHIDAFELKSDEEDQLQQEMTRMRLVSLPAPTPEHLANDDRFESSVEYLLSNSSDSDTSSKRSTRSTRSSTKGSTSDCKARMSSQENVRCTPKKRVKRRYSRQHSSAMKSLFNSNASLPEFQTTSTSKDNNTTKHQPSLRRTKSFYDYSSSRNARKTRQAETFTKQSSLNSDTTYSTNELRSSSRRLRRTPSSLSNHEKSPVKRKISLNEYIIVGRHSIYDVPSKTEYEFKNSL